MKHKPNSMQILVAVNCAALCLLAFVELTPPAGAQAGRTRGTYTAATGRIPGTETFALYVVDETTQELIAVQWDIEILRRTWATSCAHAATESELTTRRFP